ncbi:hypothetical protein EV2_010370 [Malus domestica]
MEQNKLHTPDIVILLETKNRSNHYVFLKKRLGMDFMHAIEPRGIAGGMCIFWRNYDLVMLVKYSDFFIEVGISDKLKEEEWRLFAVYASTDDKKRRDQWRILSQRLGAAGEKCVVIRDFNDILDDSENEGGITDLWQAGKTFVILFLAMSYLIWALQATPLPGGTEGMRDPSNNGLIGDWHRKDGSRPIWRLKFCMKFWKDLTMLC